MIIFIYKNHPKLYDYHAATFRTTLFLSLLFFDHLLVTAQPASPNPDLNPDPIYTGVTVAIFTFLFLLSYLLFYYCFNHFFRSPHPRPGHQARRAHDPPRGGLDPSILKTFPIFTYSEVMDLGPDKGPLECAVCLSPFEADETLRLLPKCDHVFHHHCVDPWLAAHVTCPLCRANLEPQPDDSTQVDLARLDDLGVVDHVNGDGDFVEVRPEIHMEGQDGKYWRWHSTGHIGIIGGVENNDRFTLRLPEDVRNDVLAGKLNRSRSCIITIEVE